MNEKTTNLGFLVDLPDHANLTSKDFASLLGISLAAFHNRVCRGKVPRPYGKLSQCNTFERPSFGNKFRKSSLWKVGDVKRWLVEQDKKL